MKRRWVRISTGFLILMGVLFLLDEGVGLLLDALHAPRPS